MNYEWVGAVNAADARSSRLASTATEAKRADHALVALQEQIDQQALLIRSLLVLVDRKGLTTEKDFKALLEEVDLSDGKRDGKYRPTQVPKGCPKCKKTNSRRAAVCMYCGTELAHNID